MKDSNGNALIPGRCYCMVEECEDGEGGTYQSYGALAWYCSDGRLYDAQDDKYEVRDISHYDYDSLVLQDGKINPEYVDSAAA